jgi:hypothetical protein
MRIRLTSPLFSIGAAFVIALVVSAQEPAAPDVVTDEIGIETLFDTDGIVPGHLRDAGFDQFVDLKLLGEALNDQDAAALCDLALQLINGEQALLRAHKSIKARTVLDVALRYAVAKKDRATLDRMAKIADKLNDTELKQQVSASQPLLAAARSPGISVKLDELDVNDVLTYQSYSKEILRARALQDKEDLEALKAGLVDSPILSATLRSQIGKDIDQAIKDTQAPKSAEELEALRLLSAANRDSNKSDVRNSVAKGWAAIAYGKEVEHSEYGKLVIAMATGTVGVYMADMVKSSSKELGTSAVMQAIMKRRTMIAAGKFVCQSEIATYDHWKYIVIKIPNPNTGKFVEAKKKINIPSTHQPYIRWKRK